jgi:3-oxoacyl-[acyl-carrier-protein] synthase I
MRTMAPPRIATDRAELLALAAHLAGLPASPRLIRCLEEDDVDGVVALHLAAQALQAPQWSRIVVLAADSLLSEENVHWLQSSSRLKSAAVPAGLEPGEACVALLLERPQDPPLGLALLSRTGFAVEPQAMAAGVSSTGQGLALAIHQALEGHEVGTPGWIVSDHNGEAYRANDLSLALVRCAPQRPGLAQAELSYPAIQFGDTGAARPLVNVCVALAAFARRYAPARQALVVASSDSRRRAALLLQRH